MDYIELIGLLASLLVASSLLMTSIVKLRWLNLFGAFLFFIYGIQISATSIIFVNIFIVFVNIYYLIKMNRKNDYFKILEESPKSLFLQEFIKKYEKDLRKFSNYHINMDLSGKVTFLVLSNLTPAALMIADKKDNTLEVIADYAIPEFRDFKIGNYIYNQSAFFKEKGVKFIRIHQHDYSQTSYFKNVGFHEKEPKIWEKTL